MIISCNISCTIISSPFLNNTINCTGVTMETDRIKLCNTLVLGLSLLFSIQMNTS